MLDICRPDAFYLADMVLFKNLIPVHHNSYRSLFYRLYTLLIHTFWAAVGSTGPWVLAVPVPLGCEPPLHLPSLALLPSRVNCSVITLAVSATGEISPENLWVHTAAQGTQTPGLPGLGNLCCLIKPLAFIAMEAWGGAGQRLLKGCRLGLLPKGLDWYRMFQPWSPPFPS